MDFDKYADCYDAGWKGTKSARFYDDLVKELEINPGDSVLDVGCGTGTVLKYISSKAEISGYGLDISGKMLKIAREKNPGFDFIQGDCVTLPYKDGSMDVVMACMAYHHFPNQERFREEAFRVLRQGGRLYICDPRFPWIVRTAFNCCFREAGFHTAKTSAYYAVAPFVGAFLSFVFLKERLFRMYLIAFLFMIVGSAFVAADTLVRSHIHVHQHTFTHTHDGSTHAHTVTHTHEHNHYVSDGNHGHYHTRSRLEHEPGAMY